MRKEDALASVPVHEMRMIVSIWRHASPSTDLFDRLDELIDEVERLRLALDGLYGLSDEDLYDRLKDATTWEKWKYADQCPYDDGEG